MAADELNKEGFDSAVTIDGGYSAWSDEKKRNDDGGNNK
jgi:rhodanese-related sulfurtransferase